MRRQIESPQDYYEYEIIKKKSKYVRNDKNN